MHIAQQLVVGFDRTIFFFFQGLQRSWLDNFLAWPTYLGDLPVAMGLTAGLILMIDKFRGLRKLGIAMIGLLASSGAAYLLKDLFQRPRPFVAWDHANVIFGRSAGYAFPSSHTTVVFAAAFLLDRFYPGKMRWTYLIAVWVSVTRVYIGAHYPTDLLGGALVGIGCAALCCRLFRNGIST